MQDFCKYFANIRIQFLLEIPQTAVFRCKQTVYGQLYKHIFK